MVYGSDRSRRIDWRAALARSVRCIGIGLTLLGGCAVAALIVVAIVHGVAHVAHHLVIVLAVLGIGALAVVAIVTIIIVAVELLQHYEYAVATIIAGALAGVVVAMIPGAEFWLRIVERVAIGVWRFCYAALTRS
jgi:hypothetical protein